MNQENTNRKWEFKSEVKDYLFENVDFTLTDLNHPIFNNVIFKNCLFDKTNFEDARAYRCQFIDCIFREVKLSTATMGAHGGLYQNCEFDRCNFKRASFYNPECINCKFSKCQWRGVDLCASYFDNCKFIGKLEDVTFRGRHKSDLYENAKPNPMRNVDFSEAIFGQFVSFDDCDLSTSIPPRGYSFDRLLTKSDYYPNCVTTEENGMT